MSGGVICFGVIHGRGDDVGDAITMTQYGIDRMKRGEPLVVGEDEVEEANANNKAYRRGELN